MNNEKIKYKRYTLETHPTDFHGPFTVIKDNDFDQYFTVNGKDWGAFNEDDAYEAFRFVGEGQKEIAIWWVKRWNEGNYDESPFDQKKPCNMSSLNTL